MKRRSLLLGSLMMALPRPAWAKSAPHWHSISKRRIGHATVYQRSVRELFLPVTEDVPDYRHLALKLTGGALHLEQVAYLYPLGGREVHRLMLDVAPGEILPLPDAERRPVAVTVFGEIFADGHRYWHLVGTDDPI